MALKRYAYMVEAGGTGFINVPPSETVYVAQCGNDGVAIWTNRFAETLYNQSTGFKTDGAEFNTVYYRNLDADNAQEIILYIGTGSMIDNRATVEEISTITRITDPVSIKPDEDDTPLLVKENPLSSTIELINAGGSKVMPNNLESAWSWNDGNTEVLVQANDAGNTARTIGRMTGRSGIDLSRFGGIEITFSKTVTLLISTRTQATS